MIYMTSALAEVTLSRLLPGKVKRIIIPQAVVIAQGIESVSSKDHFASEGARSICHHPEQSWVRLLAEHPTAGFGHCRNW